jgi:hypothetical protein
MNNKSKKNKKCIKNLIKKKLKLKTKRCKKQKGGSNDITSSSLHERINNVISYIN